jgi:hypothetical protein
LHRHICGITHSDSLGFCCRGSSGVFAAVWGDCGHSLQIELGVE